MEKFINKFEKEYKGNSLILQSLSTDRMKQKMKCRMIHNESINREMTNGLHMISALYLYTNAPPHGYGTPAPKVAETVLRSYQYNCREEKEEWELLGHKATKHNINEIDNYPFNNITGNYHPESVKVMATNFLMANEKAIIDTAKSTIEFLKRSNADILTQGRQTWDPESHRSITCAKAYDRFIILLKNNGESHPTNFLEMIKAYFSLFNNDTLYVKRREILLIKKKKYSKKLRQFVVSTKKKMMIKKKTINGNKEVIEWLVNYTRSFCSYIKHGERGKKDRRAIASANIPLRMLLYIVERFHLELGKLIPGSTISIGGEEKKMKINTELRSTTSQSIVGKEIHLQATEDATKWNECLNPVMFALVHHFLFDNQTRSDLKLPKCSIEETLFSHLCKTTFAFMAIKRINLGPGVLVKNDDEFKRVDWNDVKPETLNKETRKWYEEIKPYLEEEAYVRSSPGFLMGMLNAASTTIGLLPVGYHKLPNTKVTSLRSSDDTMTVFAAEDAESITRAIEINRKSLKLIGINLSTSKSFLFPEGYGEYTSWYQDGDFIGQCGVETSSLRPIGNNAQDDFNNIATSAVTLLKTFTINKFGALSRIIIGIDNVRRLWKIHKNPTKRELLSPGVLFLSDGGLCPWNLENLCIDESSLRYDATKTKEDKDYFFKVMDPQNPFSDTPEEQVAWSKQLGTLTVTEIESPRNVFCYIRRSNKSINNETSKIEAEKEKTYKEAHDIMVTADPSIHIKVPQSKVPIVEYIKASLKLRKQGCVLTKKEEEMFDEAMNILEGSDSENEADDYKAYEEEFSNL